MSGLFTFYVAGDHHSESPWRHTIPTATARRAARVFLIHARLDPPVRWDEANARPLNSRPLLLICVVGWLSSARDRVVGRVVLWGWGARGCPCLSRSAARRAAGRDMMVLG